MKKLAAISLFLLQSVWVFGQFGFMPNTFGDFYLRDLTSPGNSVLIGTTVNQVGASDFDASGKLYAISGTDDGLYIIDTTDASATLVATLLNPNGHFFTGLACDPTDGTMYMCSTDGIESSLFTLDLQTGATTLISTSVIESGIVGIAFDHAGQLYGIFLVRKFYLINKTTGAATYIGDFNEAVTAFPHHGLDYDPATQTMYMTSYNAFSFDNELWTINLETGENTLVGSVGFWTGTLAVRPPAMLSAAFSANVTTVCAGEMVNFFDESTGNPESWLWTFEGGNPATSSEQNPQVYYNFPGQYDVSLEVTQGSQSNAIALTDYIHVLGVPSPEIEGPATVCTGHTETYSTGNAGVSAFEWEVTGGTIVEGAGTSSILVEWALPGNGTVAVTAYNADCEGSSGVFNVLIDPCTGLGHASFIQKRVYPNPAKNNLLLQLKGLDAIALAIYNIHGIKVTELALNGHESLLKIDISALKPGIYAIRLRLSSGETWPVKFVKTE